MGGCIWYLACVDVQRPRGVSHLMCVCVDAASLMPMCVCVCRCSAPEGEEQQSVT